MADETKPVIAEIPMDTPKDINEAAPTTTMETVPAPESTPVGETKTGQQSVDASPTVETKVEETTAVDEAKKEDEPAKPIEEGTLEHKGPFPKSLFKAKQAVFWLRSDALNKDDLSTYLNKQKEDAQHLVSWATETGKGLLFYGESKDKIHGIFSLADSSEPIKEGTSKFVLSSKGHKHTFKAPNAAERDSWVTTLKEKIAEAKEVSKTVTESEAYKNTLESFKPSPLKKEDDLNTEAKAEDATGEVPTIAVADAKVEETEETKPEEASKEEEAKSVEELKVEEKKEPRSASRKRTSMFGFLKKDSKDEKKDEEPTGEVSSAEEAKPEETKPIEAEAPIIAESTKTDDMPATETAGENLEDEGKTEEKKEERPSPPTKRSSVFSGFFKKKHVEPETKPEQPAEESEPVAEMAPEIPPIETSTPLSANVNSPATVPTTETSAEAAAITNSETKKEMKSEKRKSSLPFAFGRKHSEDKAEKSDEEGRIKSPLFSKIRGTFKAKKPEKKEEETGDETQKVENKVEEETNKAEEPHGEIKTEELKEETPKAEATEEAPIVQSKPAAPAPVAAAA